MQRLILASRSPRRAGLLRRLGYRFRVMAPDLPEIPGAHERAHTFVRRMAQSKAAAVAGRCCRPALIVAADTVVTLDGLLLGKPRDVRDARRMLRRLSGRTHQVLTGTCVARAAVGAIEESVVFLVATHVTFRTLYPEEVAAYVASGEPSDKAGGYAIQGGAASMVKRLRGSYTNVVGLPLAELSEILRVTFGCLP